MTPTTLEEPAAVSEPKRLSTLLDAMRPLPGAACVTVDEVLERIGRKSFSAALLVVGLLMVSPLSAIPGLPAVVAIIVLTIAAQAIVGRQRLWLPGWLIRRSVSADRMTRAVEWLERPVRWVDRRISGRLAFLTWRPISSIGYLIIAAVALSWPPLSLVPMSATLTAVGLSLVAAGLTLSDGVFVLIGFAYLTLLYGAGALVLAGIF